VADLSKIVDRIHKLLALSKDGGATEAEARLAAEKAQELMTEYNLSMATVEARGGDSGAEGQRTKDKFERRQSYKWQRNLMCHLAKLNFCFCSEKFKYHAHTSSFDGYELIGRSANVVSVQITFDYLVQTIERLARTEVGDPSQYFTKYAHSFKEGCADRVMERLQERRDQEIRDQERKAREDKARASHPASAGNALVVVLGDYLQDEDDLNEDFRRGWQPGTTRKNREEWERDIAAEKIRRQELYNKRKSEILMDDPNIDPERLHLLAQGFSPETVDHILKPTKPETESQRRKRKEREERENQRYWDRVYRERSRLDSTAYSRGQTAGDGVGLDQQINESNKNRLT